MKTTKTVTATDTVTEPGATETVTEPGETQTVTETAPGETQTVTETETAPGQTVTNTITLPASTETVTLPGTTATVTQPGETVTVTNTDQRGPERGLLDPAGDRRGHCHRTGRRHHGRRVSRPRRCPARWTAGAAGTDAPASPIPGGNKTMGLLALLVATLGAGLVGASVASKRQS